MQELEEQNKILEQLCESMDKAFDYEEEKEREFKNIMAQKEEDGIKIGEKKGIKKGIKLGKAEGIAEGIIEGKSEMVKALYEDKMPLEKIAKLAKLSQNQLKKILML